MEVLTYLGAVVNWVHVQLVGEERNVYKRLFICLVQYGTRGKYPSFCCKDFFVTTVNCMFMLMSYLQINSSVHSLLEQ